MRSQPGFAGSIAFLAALPIAALCEVVVAGAAGPRDQVGVGLDRTSPGFSDARFQQIVVDHLAGRPLSVNDVQGRLVDFLNQDEP